MNLNPAFPADDCCVAVMSKNDVFVTGPEMVRLAVVCPDKDPIVTFVIVGVFENTRPPVPVSSVMAAARFADVSLIAYPANVVGAVPAVTRPFVSTVTLR